MVYKYLSYKQVCTMSKGTAELEAVLNRMSIFSGEQLTRASSELEALAQSSSFHKFVSADLLQYVVDFISTKYPDTVIKAACLAAANACTTDDLQHTRCLLALGIAECCRAVLLERHQKAACVFAVLDVVATLCTSCGESRERFRELIPAIVCAVRSHKTNGEILFATVCALSTLTLADSASCVALTDSNGLQVLVEIFRYATRHKRNPSLSLEDQRLDTDVMRWSKQALMNVMKCLDPKVDVAIADIKWGTFGEVIEVDDLKFSLTVERKRQVTRKQ